MANISETAYPRFKSSYTESELLKLFNPSEDEIIFCKKNARSIGSFLCLILTIKSFRNLGKFINVTDIPEQIVKYISKKVNIKYNKKLIENYKSSGTRKIHIKKIRECYGTKSFYNGGHAIISKVLEQEVKIKQSISDLINICVESLIKNYFELPSYEVLLKNVKKFRSKDNISIYSNIYKRLKDEDKLFIHKVLLNDNFDENWNSIKKDFNKPSIKMLIEMLKKYDYLKSKSCYNYLLENLAPSKIKFFYEIANSYDIRTMNKLTEKKRITLILCFISYKFSKVTDDICTVFIKRIRRCHKKSSIDLQKYIEENQEKTDEVFKTIIDIEDTIKSNNNQSEKIANVQNIIDVKHNVFEYARYQLEHGTKNHLRFMWKYFKMNRKSFFRILKKIKISSTTEEDGLISAIEFAIFHMNSTSEFLEVSKKYRRNKLYGPMLYDLSWVPDKWWRIVTNQKNRKNMPVEVNRRNFEVCLCDEIMNGLLNGDLCVENSIEYSDYRKELISEEESLRTLFDYGETIGIPVVEEEFIHKLKSEFVSISDFVDENYKDNKYFKIFKGEPRLKRNNTKEENQKDIETVDNLIRVKLEKQTHSLLDIVISSTEWLNWTKFFGPLSEHSARMKGRKLRYSIMTFAYGTGLGTTQTVKSIPELNRRNISFTNIRHSTSDRIDKANNEIINEYNKFDLPKCWGNNSSVSTDGTRWDIAENNLLSEYHIRYGAYGGIAYYHVTDTYIALFSHFIPCGVREAIYVFDGLSKNVSDIQPDTIHGDTHSQMLTGFGLSYLLGIKLMPRIKNWHGFKFYKPSPDYIFKSINELFCDEKIEWDVIEKNLLQMFRIAQSIKAGKIHPSSILKRLSTSSKKNKIYYAFRELGRVVRTMFLLKYLSDEDLRQMIQAATCKSESFNKFVKWLYFGEDFISENVRVEQEKAIKYNHLLANILIFYNVFSMSKAIKELIHEGHPISKKVISKLSPYRTSHINRFGTYKIEKLPIQKEDFNFKLDLL